MVEHTVIEADVPCSSGLPCQVFIVSLWTIEQTRVVFFTTDRIEVVYACTLLVDRSIELSTCILLTGLTPTQTKFQVADSVNIFQETFFFNTPCEGCCREETPTMSVGKAARTIITCGKCKEVAVQQRIVGTTIPAHEISLTSPSAGIVSLLCASKSFTLIILSFVGRWIHGSAPLVSPIFHVAILVTSCDIEVVSLVEVLGVLSISCCYNVILLFCIFAVATIVECVGRLWIHVIVFTTSGIFTS